MHIEQISKLNSQLNKIPKTFLSIPTLSQQPNGEKNYIHNRNCIHYWDQNQKAQISIKTQH